MHLAKAECHSADHFPSPASTKVLPDVYSLENLQPVRAIPGFYCSPTQSAPASAIPRNSCPTAGSEICGKCYMYTVAMEAMSYRQDCRSSFKYDLRCLVSPGRRNISDRTLVTNLLVSATRTKLTT